MATPDNYEDLVGSEDALVNRIEICSNVIDAVLQSLYEKDGSIHYQTIHEILSAMHEVQVKLERELLMIRAEKRLAARIMSRKPPDLH